MAWIGPLTRRNGTRNAAPVFVGGDQRASAAGSSWSARHFGPSRHRDGRVAASSSEQSRASANERPRETLKYEAPAERFNACVASTG
jgi:IS30 family transposase